MASDTSASIIQLHQPKPKTAAERGRAFRARKREAAGRPTSETKPASLPAVPQLKAERERKAERTFANARPNANAVRLAQIALTTAALGLAIVGVTMNGWFARSLGSSEIAGWLFLAIGVAADLVALAVPSCAAQLWHARQRGTALAGWAIWAATFAFAVTAGIGFASTNIADVTLARSSRVTPAIETAQAAVSDAMSARDRECARGVGPICRQREETVNERRRALDTAMHSIEQTADPQTEAATRIVAWVSGGVLKPTGEDFAMLRLVLLALLPQVGGILLMLGRAGR